MPSIDETALNHINTTLVNLEQSMGSDAFENFFEKFIECVKFKLAADVLDDDDGNNTDAQEVLDGDDQNV